MKTWKAVQFRTGQEEQFVPIKVSVENTGSHAVHILVDGNRIALLSATGELVLESFFANSRRARKLADLGIQVEGADSSVPEGSHQLQTIKVRK